MEHRSTSSTDDILDVCLDQMRAGRSLAVPPHISAEAKDELAILVAVGEQLRGLPPNQLSDAARDRVRRQMRAAVAERAARQQAWRRLWAPVLRFAMALSVAFVAAGGGVAAAQTSMPGEPLYGVKRASESVRLQLAVSPADRAQLHLELSERRVEEAVAMASAGSKVEAELLRELSLHQQLAWVTIDQLPPERAEAARQAYTEALGRQIDLLTAAPGSSDAATWAVVTAMTESSREALHRAGAGEIGADDVPQHGSGQSDMDVGQGSSEQPGGNGSQGEQPGNAPGGNGNQGGNGSQGEQPSALPPANDAATDKSQGKPESPHESPPQVQHGGQSGADDGQAGGRNDQQKQDTPPQSDQSDEQQPKGVDKGTGAGASDVSPLEPSSDAP
ncbi:MAG: hypothetical protein RLZZ387_2255 [Chloroflexota bacterium]